MAYHSVSDSDSDSTREKSLDKSELEKSELDNSELDKSELDKSELLNSEPDNSEPVDSELDNSARSKAVLPTFVDVTVKSIKKLIRYYKSMVDYSKY